MHNKPACRPATILAVLLLITFATLAKVGTAKAETPNHPGDALLQGFRSPPHEARPTTYWLWLNGYVNRDFVRQELSAYRDAGLGGVLIFDMGARGSEETSPPAGPSFMNEQSVANIAYAVKVAGQLGLDVQLSVASSWDMGGAWVKPEHASKGLFASEVSLSGPREFDEVLPWPATPAAAPRQPDGRLAFATEVAVLALPSAQRLPGHDFVFRLDPPGEHRLDRAVLYNTHSTDPKKHGDMHLFAKDFTIAVSTTTPAESAFREVMRSTLAPTDDPQTFKLSNAAARYVRLRVINGHNLEHPQVQLGEFELFNSEGINVVASHAADRSRDGADLLGFRSTLGRDRQWTADNIHDGSKSGSGGSWSSAGAPPVHVRDLDSIIDLSDRVQADGRLQWSVPEGDWTVLRFVCANTGETLKVPSPASDGLATDHLSREATRVFLNYEVQRLQSQMGDLSKTALKQLYLASYEVRGMLWTPKFTDRFREYRGYDMTPFLPALLGSVIGDSDTTQRFIYDYRKTLGDLLVDAYYQAAVDSAHRAGLGIESEAGGPGPPIHQTPVDALKAQGTIDEIRGEFWPKRPDADRLWVVKETACAGHIYGKKRVHMEAFTSMHQWQDGPFDLKPAADRAFCEGANHFVWHTASHLPPESGKPGWVYHAGTHLNTNIVWWPKAKSFLDYLAQCSFLLQQGNFVGDVCYYYGDQGFNFVPPKHVDPALGYGFDYDVVNRDVILHRMRVENGRLTLPEGVSYALLALPEREDIDLDVLKKVEQFVREGATVVGPKPLRTNGLRDYPRRDQQVRTVADDLWGDCDGQQVFEHAYGKGRIVWGRTLREVLSNHDVFEDFAFTSSREDAKIDFIHRRTEEADIYFVRNGQARGEKVEATFRVRGAAPEIWDPATGLVTQCHQFRNTDRGVAVPLQFSPYGSTFVVFRKSRPSRSALSLDAPQVDDQQTASIDAWDDDSVTLTVHQPGRYRLQSEDGRSNSVEIDHFDPPLLLDGPWHVQFPDGWGAPSSAVWENLISWTEHADPAIRFFSGTATYHCNFDVPESWLAEDRRVLLDLGQLWAIGDIALNGSQLGIVWKPPYVVDITAAANPGRNLLEVEVANTWSNRLVGDADAPPAERLTRTNVSRNNGRLWQDVPLKPSGLFGPVRLLPARVLTLELD